MGTGIVLLTASLLYFSLVSAFFVLMPNQDISLEGVNQLQNTPDYVDEIGGAEDSLELIDFWFGLFTFKINGLSGIWEFAFSWIPLIVFGLGLYGVIRGI